MIPKIIFQTSFPPKYKNNNHIENIKEWINEHTKSHWNYIHYNDIENIEFLKKHFINKYPNVIEKYNTLPWPAFKADLMRYAYLYINGGVYLDMDIVLNEYIEDIIEDYEFVIIHSTKWNSSICLNAFIATKANNKTMLDCFEYIYNTSVKRHGKDHYLTLCRHLFTTIENNYNLKLDINVDVFNKLKIKKLKEKRRYANNFQLEKSRVLSDIYDVSRNKIVMIHIGGGHTLNDLESIVHNV